jgi:hypothetical protein
MRIAMLSASYELMDQPGDGLNIKAATTPDVSLGEIILAAMSGPGGLAQVLVIDLVPAD